MSVFFTSDDLNVFQIPTFKERMKDIRERIRPKLVEFGEQVGPALMNKFNAEFFAHTAKHMRRKVNPPDETWVALGPESRGYKAYIFFAFSLGKGGAQARVTMKDESGNRPLLGENLLANLSFFKQNTGRFIGMQDYFKRRLDYQPTPIRDLISFLEESGERLKSLKTAQFDVGLELKATQKTLDQEFLKAVDRLYPFYLCGLQKGVRLR